MEPEPLRIRVAVEIDLVPDPGSSKPAERRPVVFRRRSRAEIREDLSFLMEAYDLLPDDGLDERGLLPVVIGGEPATAPEDVVDAVIYCGATSVDVMGRDRECALEAPHPGLLHFSAATVDRGPHRWPVSGGMACCDRELPWPASGGPDVECPQCGIVYEHDGVDIGGGARVKSVPDAGDAVEADRALYVADTAAGRDSGVLEDVALCLRPGEHPSAPPGRRVHCDRAAHHAPATDGDVGGEDGGCLQVSPAGDACVRAAGHSVILQTAHRDLHGSAR